MKTSLAALAASLAVVPPAFAESAAPPEHEIVVTAHHADHRIDLPPATRVTIDAEAIAAKINALSVEDTLKYAPSLVIRKRHVGDNFAPIATRTSGLGASARSLIYADGVLLSAFIANNNGNGSPRWMLVAPEEIEQVEVLYGPFSAAYPGNGIGTTVSITTRLPHRLEASARAVVNVQRFDLYGTHRTLPTWQVAASIGDRFGPLSLFAAFTRTDAQSQPLNVVTVPGHGNGGFNDLNRSGATISVIGVGGLEHHVQYTGKLKAALELGDGIRLSYLFGLWVDDTNSTVESYLRGGATGAPLYQNGFNAQVYVRDALHTAHAVTLEGSSSRFDWHLVGTLYRYNRDVQSGPSAAATLPAAFAGGVGAVQRQDGTGWATLDAKAAWRPHGDERHVISFGAHADRYVLDASSRSAADWLDPGSAGAITAASRGRTRTIAVWAQDRLKLGEAFTLTLGARHEWWRAWGGFNQTSAGSLSQPERRASGFSPKASLEWRPDQRWSARLSYGQAWRFPTVGELYQATTIGGQLANPNPVLRPERARSLELALGYSGRQGSLRLSFFNEVVDDALIAQTNVNTPAITTSYVQNIERTRARGVELALERRDVVPGLDLQASVTYADARTVMNAAFPASVGKLLPSVPHWKGSAVVTWRPVERWTLTAAARFASRNWGTLDNSDPVGQTFQGFYKYFVADLRATWRASDQLTLGVGIDNVNNNKYFLFHPFPQRSFSADIKWKL